MQNQTQNTKKLSWREITAELDRLSEVHGVNLTKAFIAYHHYIDGFDELSLEVQDQVINRTYIAYLNNDWLQIGSSELHDFFCAVTLELLGDGEEVNDEEFFE